MMRQSIGTIIARQGEDTRALARKLECKRALQRCQALWDEYEVASQKAAAVEATAHTLPEEVVGQVVAAAYTAYGRWWRAAERHRQIAGRCPPKNGRRR